jgi:putative ABC transport system permease protein
MTVDAKETVTMALSAVWTNKFRSFLTILGIVIGITTVVTVSSLLTGLRQGIVVFFNELGPQSIFIRKAAGDPQNQGNRKERMRRDITPEYAEFIRRLCPSVERVGVDLFIPSFVGRNPLVAKSAGFESDRVGLVGSGYEELQIAPRELLKGRIYTGEEDARGAKVAVIGANAEEALFPDGNSIGKTINLSGLELKVIGVYAKAKGGFFGENGLDRQITIPLKTAQSRYPQVRNYMIVAKAFEGRRDQAMEEVEWALRKARKLRPDQENDFNLSTPDQIVKQFDQITGMIVLASIAISAIGLLVGGIGVMNIMLVSVTERTKEIGIRKAIGARKPDIILQFLLEAVTLTGVGGVMGIVFAVAVTLLVGTLVPSLPTEVPAWAVMTGFSVSVAVGIFFGVWPAVKAARLDPVEALRYE